ncbi:MAG: NAD-dependent epimerase/dehydratase family protein [Candidatus Diapherotrites archaeon]|uniref:NAD-dependent epimerase/dehydratase family protein n=1 Tax=Candidatus Iainarchaeum sp. TaxID=3101447 RepID=A0A8T4L5K7_9ARCH|nr:NAD-dependent epimerase/dehydratase family protein [Candidatus Diapherotrites archaeon]
MARVLVTGGCGFIGSEVVKQLLQKGYDVRIADDLSKPKSKTDVQAEFLRIDLTNKTNTLRAFKGIDYCINLAAKIGGIGYFHKIPATILSENNKIYSSTFEAAVEKNIERMVYISSSMVFESTTSFPSKETDLKKVAPPITAYGFSKLSGEKYCHAFHDQFNLDYTIIRPFNAYGINEFPGQEIGYAHVIPDLTKKILAGQYPVEILGNGKQSRCFTHVSDVASGIIKAMDSKKAINEDFNISTSEETKIIELAKNIFTLCSSRKKFKTKFLPSFKDDVQRRIPDVSKAKNLLHWQAKIPLNEGLKEVVDWLKYKLKKTI